MPRPRAARMALPIILIALAMGCSDNGPGSLDVSGSWSGVTSFNNGFSTSMDLTQTGTAVGGTMTVAGAFIDNTFTGTLDATNRTVEWEVLRGCESWGGTLSVSADGTQMTGALLVDRTGCSSGSNESGTVSVSR